MAQAPRPDSIDSVVAPDLSTVELRSGGLSILSGIEGADDITAHPLISTTHSTACRHGVIMHASGGDAVYTFVADAYFAKNIYISDYGIASPHPIRLNYKYKK